MTLDCSGLGWETDNFLPVDEAGVGSEGDELRVGRDAGQVLESGQVSRLG